nr:MAG TPA: hypothetical protein [Caudoviricetes sp.]
MDGTRRTPQTEAGRQQHTPPPFHSSTHREETDTIHTVYSHTVHVHTTNEQSMNNNHRSMIDQQTINDEHHDDQ